MRLPWRRALLVDSEQHATPFDQLVRHAALFPFDVGITARRVRMTDQLRVHREGLDVDVVELATERPR